MTVISPRALIEVALPLDAINEATAAEKAIRKGHPSTLHLWWARRPLAAARAVIFGQLVHDPEDLWRCQNPGKAPNQQVRGHWKKARARLFKIIEDLVLWENTANVTVLKLARETIRESWRQTCELNKNHPRARDLFDPEKMPALHDPFAGGGAIPLEAQRLGLEAFASDLNPVAVLINKAMIEIPPKFVGAPPVHPETRAAKSLLVPRWEGVAGLAEDVRRYGHWMLEEARRRIGHLYPPVVITKEMAKERPDLKALVGQELTVVAWLWARTVRSPNPAYAEVEVPLASSFTLCDKPGRETYVQPIVGKSGYSFKVKVGRPPAALEEGTKASRGTFRCLLSDAPIDGDYLRSEAMAGRMNRRLMAVVATGARGAGRVYLSPTSEHESVAESASPTWKPDVEFFQQALGFRVGNYGMTKWSDLFTSRQLVALTTLADLVGDARQLIRRDAAVCGLPDNDISLDAGGTGARAYAEAVSLYLAFSVSKSANRASTLCTFKTGVECPGDTFGRQALSMSWDFSEANTLSGPSGSFESMLENTVAGLLSNGVASDAHGLAYQADATTLSTPGHRWFSTDPPYYDNIGYADLSDFFYVWLRRALRTSFTELLATIAVPKAEELVATPWRHGTKDEAEQFFLGAMTRAMRNLSAQSHPAGPMTIYYAFKQSDTESVGTNSTGWETFLDAVLKSGLQITGTWPMRTERANRKRAQGSNALASSIVLACRPRVGDAGTISRRSFVRLLNEALPPALDTMTRDSEGLHSPVAPVDLSQAIIGPGMAIFSRYDAVLEADGTPMSVKTALQLINRFLAEDDFDPDTQFCLHWFDQHGWETSKFGEADTLARAKGTSVEGVKHAGVAEAGSGNVRLLRWKEYPVDWDPTKDARLPIWEVLHQLIRAYKTDGDSGAAKVLAAAVSKAEAARQLAYRLYTLCERKGWAEDARAYNEVVAGWSGIETATVRVIPPEQRSLFDDMKES